MKDIIIVGGGYAGIAIKGYLKNNIDNLIFTNFLAYDRDDKVKSIIRELEKLTKYYEKKFIQ